MTLRQNVRLYAIHFIHITVTSYISNVFQAVVNFTKTPIEAEEDSGSNLNVKYKKTILISNIPLPIHVTAFTASFFLMLYCINTERCGL